MHAPGTMTSAPSFALAEPLDWFQLRALLWEVVDTPAVAWRDVPARLAERCPRSAPVTADACREAYERIAQAFPPRHGAASAGATMWTELLYSSVHRLFPQTPIFMNLGYFGEVTGLQLEPEDQPLHPFIALYRRAIQDVAIEGRDVVDVGCGAGGGCWHLRRYLAPGSVTGVDLVEANIAAAERVFRDPALRFLVGPAERLPLPSDSADVVVCVESSHSYHSFPAFVGEVRRVLRPGGTFALADHRPLRPDWGDARTMARLEADLAASGLEIVARQDLTAGVVACCEALMDFKEQMLRDTPLSDADRRHLREILHGRGSQNHARLASGDWSYRGFTLRKLA